MILRLGTKRLILWTTLCACVAFVLVLPFALYRHAFLSRLRDSQEKWDTLGSIDYEILVASNSLTQCTGGWNTILIRNGEVLQGNNSEHGECARDEFALLTVEALFARVWDECILRQTLVPPLPLCHVAYDERLGYPRRVDTYTLTESGEHAPSITVDGIFLDP